MAINSSAEDRARRLRHLELEAYASVISVFRAHGELTDRKSRILNELKGVLKVTPDRHVAEVKRALNDDLLAAIAFDVFKTDLVGENWLAEVRSPFAGDIPRTRRDPPVASLAGRPKARVNDENVSMLSTVEQLKVSATKPGLCADSNQNVENLHRIDVETQTDFEEQLQKQVAAIVAEIVDGRRELGVANSSDDEFDIVDIDRKTGTKAGERKTSRKIKPQMYAALHKGKVATSWNGKQELVNTSKRRVKLQHKNNKTARKKMQLNGERAGGRKGAAVGNEPVRRKKRMSRAADSENESFTHKQPHAKAQTSNDGNDGSFSVSAASPRASQQTRLHVLDSSQAPRDLPSTSSASPSENDDTMPQTVEISDQAFSMPAQLEADLSNGHHKERMRSDSEGGSLNLNDTNFFIQHTMLTVDKHEVVSSASGVNELVDHSVMSASHSETPTGAKLERETAVRGRKAIKRSPHGLSPGDEQAHAAARPTKRAKKDPSLSGVGDANARVKKPRKKRIAADDSNAASAQSAADKAAGFKVKLPALRKTPTGPANGSTGRSGGNSSASNGRVPKNAQPQSGGVEEVANSGLLAPPVFACATGTGYNFASLARHSTTPPSAAQRIGLSSADSHHSPSVGPSSNIPSHASSSNNPFLIFDQASIPSPSETVTATVTDGPDLDLVEETVTSLPASGSVSTRLASPMQPAAVTASAIAAAWSNQMAVNAASSVASFAGTPQARGTGSIAIRARSAIAASAPSVARPQSIGRIVCVDRPQAPVTRNLTPTAIRAAGGPTAAGVVDYQRSSMMLAPRHISLAAPRGAQIPLRGTPPNPVSVIVQSNMSAPPGMRPPVVTRRLPSQSIVSVIKPTLPNTNSQFKYS